MKVLLVTIFVLVFSCTHQVHAQEVNIIEEEIAHYLPNNQIADRARAYLIWNLEQANFQKVESIYTYLIQKEDSTTISFYSQEKILLLFWLSDFQPLLKQINQPVDFGNAIINWPAEDYLFATLIEVVGNNRFNIAKEISADENLSEEEKDFLLIALGFYIGENYEKQANINLAADTFLNSYPESSFRKVVENSYKQVYYPSNSGFSISAFIGENRLTNELSDQFRDGFSFGFSAAYYYHSFMLQTTLSLGITAPRNDLILSDVAWDRGHTSMMTQFEASLGYVFLKSKRFSIIPFGGIGTTSISPTKTTTEEEEYFEGVAFKAKFTNYAGIGIRFNLQKQDKAKTYSKFEDKTYSYLLLQYRYAKPFLDRGYDGMAGTTNLISLSYGGFIKPVKRR